jgi:hypothetical protein
MQQQIIIYVMWTCLTTLFALKPRTLHATHTVIPKYLVTNGPTEGLPPLV